MTKFVTDLKAPNIEKKRGGDTLLRREGYPQSFTENIPLPYHSLDNNGYLTDVNSLWIEKFGYSPGEILGQRFDYFLVPKHANHFCQLFLQFLHGGENHGVEFEMMRKDGYTIPVLCDCKIEYDTEARFKQVHCIVQDITDRKKAEKALKDSEKKYRNLVDNSIEGIVFAKETRVVDANRALLDLFGYDTLEEIVRIPFLEHVAPESREEMQDRLKRWKDNEPVYPRYESKGIRKDGEIIELEVSTTVVMVKNEVYRQSIFRDITDRKKAEKALKDSEKKYRNLFDNSIEGIVLTKEHRVVDGNRTLLDIFGYDTLEEYVKFPVLEHVAPESREEMEGKLKRWKNNEPVYPRYEIQGIRKDGEIIELEVSTNKIVIGKEMYRQSTFRDITDRKKAEKALKDSEKKYRNLFDNSIEGIGVSRDGKIIAANRALLDLFGYETLEEFIRIPMIDHMMPEFRGKVRERVNRAVEDEPQAPFECSIIRKDGEVRKLEILAKEIVVGNSKFRPSTFRDITGRKQAEEALRKSREEYRSLVESAYDSIYLLDKNCTYLFANKKHASRMGLAANELIGKNYAMFHLGDDTKKLAANVIRVFETGESIQQEHKASRDNKYFLRTLSPVKGPEGKVTSVTVVSKDITERKRAENELKNSRGQLRNLTAHLQSIKEEERTYIAREIHDELGQLLTALKIDLSWLLKKFSKKKKILREKIESMLKLIDATILTVKKISAELRPGLLDDLGLVAAIEWQIEEFKKRHKIAVEVNIDNEDIAMEEKLATAIFRIFQETLTNIARHANATMVTVSLKEGSGSLALQVADNGRGITEDQIFGSRSFGLIGIKERVNQWNGMIDISGVLDKGTTVKVTIPIDCPAIRKSEPEGQDARMMRV